MAGVVVVSTHLDDAVFSCWSVIADAQHDVTVVTVFTSAVAGARGWWDALTDPEIDSIARAEERRAEDAAALGRAGRLPVHLPFSDRQFGATDPARIVDALGPIVEAADAVYAPLAISNDEHVTVRDAVRSLIPRPAFYVDYPYALRDPVEPRGAPPGLLDGYEQCTVELDDLGATEKVEACRRYSGELTRLESDFGDFATVENLRRETFYVP